jgi:hypothetical protein
MYFKLKDEVVLIKQKTSDKRFKHFVDIKLPIGTIGIVVGTSKSRPLSIDKGSCVVNFNIKVRKFGLERWGVANDCLELKSVWEYLIFWKN